MKKNIRTKLLVRAIVTSALLLVSTLGVAAMGNKSAWSFSDEEATYRQELWDSGIHDLDEIDRLCYEKFPDNYYCSPEETAEVLKKLAAGEELPPDHYHSDSSTASAPAASTEATPSTSNTTKSESKTTSEAQTEPVKFYEHEFDAITDEAKDNFIHFSEDGTPDSMYLNIRMESSMNTITGRELNATTTGNEVGTINYVDAEGNAICSWVFENWKSDDDYYLDLSAYLKTYASEELVAAYEVSLQDATLPEGNTVVLKVQSPYADGTVVNIFTEETGELKETGKTLTVADGCITFEFTDAISTPVMSPETLIAVSTSEVKEDVSKDTVAAEAAPAEAVNEAVLEVTSDPALSSNTETVQNNNTKYIIGIICAVLVVAVGVFAVNNKRKVKAA